MNSEELLRKSKVNLNIIAGFLIIISILSAVMNVVQETFGARKIISLGITALIIFALYNGKKWAKNYILVVSILSILMYFLTLLGALNNRSWGLAIAIFLLIICFGYIIIFLNSKTYNHYMDMSKSGVDIHNPNLKEFESIISSDKLIDIDAKNFEKIDDYQTLAKLIMDKVQISNKIERIHSGDSKLEIETADEIIPIKIDNSTNFFDKSFLSKLEFTINRLSGNDWILDCVYPSSKLNLAYFKICYADEETFSELRLNGYY